MLVFDSALDLNEGGGGSESSETSREKLSAAKMFVFSLAQDLNEGGGGIESSVTSRDKLAARIRRKRRRKMQHSWSDEVQAVVWHHM